MLRLQAFSMNKNLQTVGAFGRIQAQADGIRFKDCTRKGDFDSTNKGGSRWKALSFNFFNGENICQGLASRVAKAPRHLFLRSTHIRKAGHPMPSGMEEKPWKEFRQWLARVLLGCCKNSRSTGACPFDDWYTLCGIIPTTYKYSLHLHEILSILYTCCWHCMICCIPWETQIATRTQRTSKWISRTYRHLMPPENQGWTRVSNHLSNTLYIRLQYPVIRLFESSLCCKLLILQRLGCWFSRGLLETPR